MNSIDLFCHEWQVCETSKDKSFELLIIICKCVKFMNKFSVCCDDRNKYSHVFHQIFYHMIILAYCHQITMSPTHFFKLYSIIQRISWGNCCKWINYIQSILKKHTQNTRDILSMSELMFFKSNNTNEFAVSNESLITYHIILTIIYLPFFSANVDYLFKS